MTRLPFLAIKDFDRHQHYKDRRPPWIKLYASLLTDMDVLTLPEAAQAQLIKLWVLASQFGNPLPNNPKLLAGKIGTTGRFYLKELIAAGFLIECEKQANAEQSASADASKTSGSLAERESSEKETTPHPSAREPDFVPPIKLGKTPGERSLALRLSNDSDRNALTVVCAKVPNAATWVAEANASLDGMHGFQLTPVQLGEALRDYVGNGALTSPSLNHFRKYLQRAGRAAPMRTPASEYDALDQWAKDSAERDQ